MDFTRYYSAMMNIQDQETADALFEQLILRCIAEGTRRLEAEKIQRDQIGYYAGYYDSETRERVERLFRCVHPFFGSFAENGEPPPEEAYLMGFNYARLRVGEPPLTLEEFRQWRCA